ncbi:TetR/AcrR family transcriptional regulator [Rhodoferax aquaticus]|uniref:TetR/AcrR family transcriptional regulator n=1 Tax=Rhodoferax aquaticus TaxID=2527691 RepID=A0A515EQ74_9BURK|nr:TetR/AcrR family transcriptional regulator [Rhodoferax aquaticus]QDL54796.1 TetR/AcrR family transcriptional regulator [Rhodoferax aquaticus]
MDPALPTLDTNEHRIRLFEGMARAVASKGYGASTIADIVREASVSRRTFYEHFATKADCLVALYENASRNALAVLRATLDPERDWHSQIEEAITAYLGYLGSNPVLTQTLFIEILGLGAPGLAARRRVHQEIADFMRAVINASEGRQVLSPELAMAMVGSVNELALELIEQDRVHEMKTIAVTTATLVRAVVDFHSPKR